MTTRDLDGGELPRLDWSDTSAAPLALILEHALSHATRTEHWYARKRYPKRIGGQILRVASIVLAAIAAVIPVLAEISSDRSDPVIAPGWASVALILAASLVALDRYFGFSTAWTRFMVTELRVARLRHDFEYSWQEILVGDAGGQSRVELLQLAHRFTLAVDAEVERESESWSTEFRASLESGSRELVDAQRR